jgi:hypothetical protein
MMSDSTIWIPVIAVVGSALSIIAVYLDHRSSADGGSLSPTAREEATRRTERMATLRWAAELAVSADPAQAQLGVRTLSTLAEEADEDQRAFIEAALLAVLQEPTRVLQEVVDEKAAQPDYSNVRFITTWGVRGAQTPIPSSSPDVPSVEGLSNGGDSN